MVTIQKIVFKFRTSDTEDAGTDGEVYVGFCGREFHVGTSYEDFERGTVRRYSSGTRATEDEVNLNNPTLNDPRFLSTSRFRKYRPLSSLYPFRTYR